MRQTRTLWVTAVLALAACHGTGGQVPGSAPLVGPPADGGTAPHVDGGSPGDGGSKPGADGGLAGGGSIQDVFVIILENHDWSDFKGNPSAPYLNNTLLPQASHAEQYYNPPGNHPSLPNYLWMVAGTNFGILDDNSPARDAQSTHQDLADRLNGRGIPWRSYLEDTDGSACPLTDNATGTYAVRHVPFMYFNDLTGNQNPSDPGCIAHNRPFSELSADLGANTVARFNFVVPNTCDDGHDSCAPLYDTVRQTDNWLAAQVPMILSSAAYRNNGALFIVWDESITGDGPIGMIVLSPLAKGNGYNNSVYYNHGSLLRTWEEIFGVTPLLGDSANQQSLSDLFASYP